MDNIQRLLDEIRNDSRIKDHWFSSKFLNNVGYVFETEGVGATELYLMKWEDKKIKQQAKALKCVLNKLINCQEIINNRALGRYVFKNLEIILRGEKLC